MPFDLATFVDPATTTVVTCEMQRGVIGDIAPGRELVAEVEDLDLVARAVELVTAARAHGVRVVHATVELRADRAGLSINNPMMRFCVKNPDQVRQGSPYADLLPELGPEPVDIVCNRIHGLTPFTGTELDSILRNLGIRTIVPIGVSVNEALLGLCMSAADLGYQLALPTDAVAGIPRAYTEAVLQHTLRLLANLTTTDEVIAAWG